MEEELDKNDNVSMIEDEELSNLNKDISILNDIKGQIINEIIKQKNVNQMLVNM